MSDRRRVDAAAQGRQDQQFVPLDVTPTFRNRPKMIAQANIAQLPAGQVGWSAGLPRPCPTAVWCKFKNLFLPRRRVANASLSELWATVSWCFSMTLYRIPDPAERAVKMATAMREEAGQLIVAWRERGRHPRTGRPCPNLADPTTPQTVAVSPM
jgi:hypothetical protein